MSKETTLDRVTKSRNDCEDRATRDPDAVALRKGYQQEAARQQAQPMKDVRTPPRTIHVYPDPETSRRQNAANRADMERRGMKVWPKGYGR